MNKGSDNKSKYRQIIKSRVSTDNKIVHSKSKVKQTIEESVSLQKNLKAISYKVLLNRVRKQLPKKNQRAFSRVIHAYGMDSLNDLTTKTLARPMSILVGSLFAITGVVIGIYLSKSHGYNYNYLLLFLFFVGGYVIELLIESLVSFFIRLLSS